MKYQYLPKTRKEALKLETKFYFTGKFCRNHHLTIKYTKDKKCKQCASNKRKRQYNSNKDLEKSKHREWVEKNKSHLNQYMKNWRENNPEKQKKNAKKSRENNKEKLNKHNRDYKKNNRALFNRIESIRRAETLEAIPVWIKNNPSGMKLISDIYIESQAYKKVLNIDTHVDHIVPLKGKRRLDDKGKMVHVVCGLHTPANLQIIYGQDNISKNCYQWPDM